MNKKKSWQGPPCPRVSQVSITFKNQALLEHCVAFLSSAYLHRAPNTLEVPIDGACLHLSIRGMMKFHQHRDAISVFTSSGTRPTLIQSIVDEG